MSKKLFKRLIIDDILQYVDTEDILVLHGARQVGKTSILYYLQNILTKQKKPTYYIDLEDSRYVTMLNAGPDELVRHLKERGMDLSSKVFVFIDEIQYLSNPSSFLKLIADHYKNIKLIVSGSSSFEIKSKFKDSLVGRMLDFEIFNLNFEEFLLFKEHATPLDMVKKLSGVRLDEIRALFKEYALCGGYPKVVLADSLHLKEKYIQQIIDTYIRKDIRDLAAIRDVDKFNRLVEMLASQSGKLLNVAEVSNTCNIAKQTVERYLFILENTYVIKLVKPFSGNLRSELFKMPKIFFYDSGLMQMLWLKGLQKEIMGNVFETAVFSELVKKYSKDSVFHWRTMDKKEIDFILKIKNEILPIEAKINFEQFNPSAISYFKGKYKISDHRLIALKGSPRDEYSIYPWEI
ncbi:ATP-binding protein [Elusimicrobiota bacterium]